MSHETIYRSLFVQARGALKKELIGHLRAGRRMRYPKGGTTPSRQPGQIVDAISIRERPAEIEDRAVPGHWEGDLLSATNNSHMATLVERHSRFAMLVKVRGKDTASVVSALSKQVRQLPLQLRRSLTWERGKEMADHKSFTLATDVQVYFCDPRSPWQRGSNENTNGLLRQYFPKGTDLSGYSQSYLNNLNIALSAGFGSAEAFTRAFRSRFGCSPTAWCTQQVAQRRTNSNPGQVMSKMSQVPATPSAEHRASRTPNMEASMNVKLVDRQPVTVAYLRHLGPYGEPISLFWQNTYYPWAVTNNLLERPRYGISHDDPSITAAEQCRYDACAEIAPDFVASGGAFKTTIPGGQVCCPRLQG